jgi:hypothetical protein
VMVDAEAELEPGAVLLPDPQLEPEPELQPETEPDPLPELVSPQEEAAVTKSPAPKVPEIEEPAVGLPAALVPDGADVPGLPHFDSDVCL